MSQERGHRRCRLRGLGPAAVGLLLMASCGGAGSSTSSPSGEAHPPEARPTERHDGAGEGGHHGGAHRFEDAERWAERFEDPSRDEWQRPEVVISALGLSDDSRVADIGAATGYFPIRLAAEVPDGRVWGVDIEPSMVRYLNARARREGHDNLFALLGTAEDPLIPEPVDVVLIVNTYHHIESRADYFARLRGSLREGGRVAVVDYRMGDLPMGPPDSMKLAPEQVRAELEEAGYRLIHQDTDSLPYQYILIFGVS